MLRRTYLQLGLALLTFALGSRAAWGDHATHEMLSNVPHDAIARGLVSAIPVDVTGARSAAEVQQRVQQTAVRCSMALRRQMHPAVERIMRALRRARPRMLPMRFDRVLVNVRNGQPILPGLEPTPPTPSLSKGGTPSMPPLSKGGRGGVKRQFGGGRLSFVFQGFTAQEERQFRDFLNQAIPVVESIYGLPAQSRTITIRIEKNLAQALEQLGQSPAREIEGGFYNVSTDEILIPPLLFGNFQADALNLLHLIVHAFHGSLMFSFDAWEEGWAQTVALLAFMRLFPDFDPRDDPFYFIQTYDMNNQPPLGNSTFYPPTGYDGMTPWRIGMSLSAWLKVYVENPNFFAQFNSVYYQQFNPNDAVPLSGNVPALKQIAMNIMSIVEGLTFTDWYRRQHVLDTSISMGNKLYAFNLPFPEDISIIIALYYYRTEVNGDETPLQTTAQLCYSNDEVACDPNDPDSGLFAEEGNEADIVDGIGAIAPQFFNIGGANRITIDIFAEDSFRRIIFPYGVSGDIGSNNQLFGAVLDSDEGEIAVTIPGVGTRTTRVRRGVFNFGSDVGIRQPTQITIQFTPTEGRVVTVRRNVGWGFYATLFSASFDVITLSHTFSAGFNMMSLPLTPILSDEADALGIPRNRLLLARFKPNLPGENKYEIYPNLSEPLGPGVGMWLRLEQDTLISVQGVPLPNFEDGVVPLLRGFNQVGVPHNRAYTVSALRVRYRNAEGEQNATIDQAVAAGVLSQGIWSYSQAEGFTLLTNQSLVEPFRAYFIRSKQDGARLIFPAPASLAQRVLGNWEMEEFGDEGKRSRTKTTGSPGGKKGSVIEWRVKLSALSALAKDRDNGFGVTRGATRGLDNVHDIVQPPEIGQFVSLSFPFRTASVSERLAYDIRAPYKGEQSWDFIVESDLSHTDVTLTWDVSGVPSAVNLKLIDLDAGNQAVKMKPGQTYQFRTGAGYTLRRFRVVATVRARRK
ncbi:MAG: hypothetical protein NZT92_07320 [Abditibacteriales bacterium]|nr:hypothetical protein [Abditibacteriales bacterium]